MPKTIIRTASFLSKEIREILRQPWLVVRLVLGPFLILLLVGLGYTGQPRVMRALFVVPLDEPAVAAQIEQYVGDLGPQLDYAGQTVSRDEALARLRVGQVDLVVVYPARAYETVQSGAQAIIEVYHGEIDPTMATYVRQLGRVYVGEMNRRILEFFAAEAKEKSAAAQADLEEARSAAANARAAAQAGDSERAEAELLRASGSLDQATALMAATALIMGGVSQGLGANLDAAPPTEAESAPGQVQIDQRLAQADQELAALDEQLARFENVPPAVMVSPLATETKTIATFTPSFVIFYAPGVLALILQHVAISIASLALVREKLFGAMELFRVAPITAFEILLGKYGSYLLFTGFLAVVLTTSMITLLGVPLLGSVAWLALSLALLVFASLGIGFAISATSRSDSDAVQFAMLVLLASMFFSGFVFPLQSIMIPVRYIGFLLPVTYSIQNLQDVMLKGVPPATPFLAALALMGILLFLFAWWRYRRAMIRL